MIHVVEQNILECIMYKFKYILYIHAKLYHCILSYSRCWTSSKTPHWKSSHPRGHTGHCRRPKSGHGTFQRSRSAQKPKTDDFTWDIWKHSFRSAAPNVATCSAWFAQLDEDVRKKEKNNLKAASSNVTNGVHPTKSKPQTLNWG